MNADDKINQWKETRRTQVPDPPEDFTGNVLRRLDSSRPTAPLIWFCRLALVVLAVALVAGRLLVTASALLSSTSTQ